MRWAPPLAYLAVTLAVAGPLLAPGYVFALDHAMGPRVADYYQRFILSNDDAIQNKGAYAFLLTALTFLMPAWAAQKLLLFAPFFLAGWGAHVLASRRVGAPAAFFAGLVYTLSPFAYVRGVAGQTGVLWAYALAPWFLAAWLRALDGSRRAFAAAALLAFATGVFQAHGLAMLAVLVALLFVVRLAREPRRWRAHAARPLMLAAALLLLNAAWLVPVALASRTTLDGIGVADRAYFRTSASGMPSVGAAAVTLQGFWRPGYEGPYDGKPWLLVVPAALLLLCVHGFRSRRDETSTALALAGALGFVLAVGPASPVTAPLWDWAWDHVPLVRGFRDSQKLLALLALAYADLGAAGADALLAKVRAPRFPRLAPWGAAALLLAMPFATAAPLLGGYGGQLGVTEYPPEWRAAEEMTRDCTGSMVLLPWHLYADASWLPNDDKRVTSPAKLYFSCPLVASDDVEAGGSAGRAGEPVDRYVAFVLRQEGARTMGNLLSAVNVQYLLLLKEADWRAQARELGEQRDLRLVMENARLQVWQNLAETAPAWRTEQVVPVASWDDLVPLSEERPLAGVVLSTAGTTPSDGARVTGTEGVGKLVWTPRADAPTGGWTLDGDEPTLLSLGVSPVFDAPDGGIPTRAGAVRAAVALWAVSAMALVACGLALLPSRRKVSSYSGSDQVGAGHVERP